MDACTAKTLKAVHALVKLTRRQHSYAYADPPVVDITLETPAVEGRHNDNYADSEVICDQEKPRVYSDQVRLTEEVSLSHSTHSED